MREFQFTACECGAMFPKRYDRVSECPRCGRDSDLPGVDTHTGEYLFDCFPVEPFAEVM